MDYIGNQRSPLWDDMETLEDENAKMSEELPLLEQDISRFQVALADAKRKTRVIACYKLADPESTVSLTISASLTHEFFTQNALSTKALVAKLSGFTKFELDLKLNLDHFTALVFNLSGMARGGEF